MVWDIWWWYLQVLWREVFNLTVRDGLANNYVIAVYRELDNVMWFATHGGGVSRYDGKTFVNLTKSDGLLSNWVNTVIVTMMVLFGLELAINPRSIVAAYLAMIEIIL